MVNCESAQLLVIDSIYASLAAAQQRVLQQHLDSCQTCQALYQEMADTIACLPQASAAVPGTPVGRREHEPDGTLDTLWTRLEPELDRIDARRYHSIGRSRHRWPLRAGMAMAACVGLLAVGLALNDLFTPESPPSTPVATTAPSPASSQGDPALSSFLTRVRPAVLTLANATPEDMAVMPLDRSQAQSMAREASLLGNNQERKLSGAQQELLRELELLLLQYANLEDGDLAGGLEVLQLFLSENYVLFKLKLDELQARDTII